MDTIGFELPCLGDGDALLEAIRERSYPRAYALLRRAGPLGKQEAGECLAAALACTDRLLGKLLELCPWTETAAGLELPLPGRKGRTAGVFGTLATLAAAAGEAGKLRLLLERGCDPAGASFGAYEAVQCGSWDEGPAMIGASGDRSWSEGDGCAVSRVRWSSGEARTLSSLTPLAAAVLFGRADCVRLLLGCPGLPRTGEALGSAALLAARGTPEQRACVRLVFGLSPEAGDPAEALCAGGLIPAASVLRFGTLRALRLRLKCPDQTEEALLGLLGRDELWLGAEPAGPERLCAVLSRRPELARRREAQALLLRVWFSIRQGPAAEALLTLWKRCGEERDVTPLLGALSMSSLPLLKDCLTRLAEGGRLCAAAEGVGGYWSEARLGTLLRQVRFYRCTRRGISALACRILETGSLRLMRSALRRGVLAGEEPGLLLEYVRRQELSPAFRAAILTMPQQPRTEERPAPEGSWSYWSGQKAKEGELWAPGTSEAELRERLAEYYHDAAAGDGDVIPSPRWEVFSRTVDGVEAYELYTIALCAESPALLRALRDSFDYRRVRPYYAGCRNEETVRAEFRDLSGEYYGSPMGLSALCGRCSQLRILLEAGEDPDDRRRGLRSILALRENWEFEDFLVTPLALALWRGHGEAAALLEAAGADRALADVICARIRAYLEKTKPEQEEA